MSYLSLGSTIFVSRFEKPTVSSASLSSCLYQPQRIIFIVKLRPSTLHKISHECHFSNIFFYNHNFQYSLATRISDYFATFPCKSNYRNWANLLHKKMKKASIRNVIMTNLVSWLSTSVHSILFDLLTIKRIKLTNLDTKIMGDYKWKFVLKSHLHHTVLV